MATQYFQKIITDIKNLTSENVQIIYGWITDCVKAYNDNVIPKFKIHYKRGEISCMTDNLKEFIQNSYGLDVEVHEFFISYYSIGLSFRVDTYIETATNKEYVRISISSDNINSISNIVSSLKKILKENSLKGGSQNQQLPNITIEVGGDLTMTGSAIGNNIGIENKDVSKNHIGRETNQPNGIFNGIFQQIMSNWIWWLLGLLGTGIIACLGIA